jgi:Immunity protein 22
MPMELSHIWLGNFQSLTQLNSYFNEAFESDGTKEKEPFISQFAADQDERFYDHDWIEFSFEEGCDLRVLLAQHSYASDYTEEVLEKAYDLNLIGKTNTFILADRAEFDHPQSIKTALYQLWYLGIFSCSIE